MALFKNNTKKWSILGVAVILLIGGCNSISSKTNENLEVENTTIAEKDEQIKSEVNIEDLTTVWANALKSRDGTPRYEMMSEKAKEKFKQEQIIRSGEHWNYNIGDSSPWVVDFEIKIDGMNATIDYVTETSEPSSYKMRESLSFAKENGNLVVDDYQTGLAH